MLGTVTEFKETSFITGLLTKKASIPTKLELAPSGPPLGTVYLNANLEETCPVRPVTTYVYLVQV